MHDLSHRGVVWEQIPLGISQLLCGIMAELASENGKKCNFVHYMEISKIKKK